VSRPPLPLCFGGGQYPGRPRPPRLFLRPERLLAPLGTVSRVGPSTARRLRELGLQTVGDLLEHYPRRYEDFRQRRTLGALKIGEEATVRGVVQRVALTSGRRKGLKVVRATVRDESGAIEAIWFNQAWLADVLEPGAVVSLRGTLATRGRGLAFVVKSHEILGSDEETLHTEGVVPVYPASEAVSARLLRTLVRAVLPEARRVPDPVPPWLRVAEGLPARCDALVAMHLPADPEQGVVARQRLVFEELYLLQLGLLVHKAREQASVQAWPLAGEGDRARRFIDELPFALTVEQQSAIAEIDRDVTGTVPMRRLLQGDVGAGKTVVALQLLLRAVDAGHQAALLVPTETLAGQHLATVHELVGDVARCELLTAGSPAPQRRETLRRLRTGETQLVVGTHALIQTDVRFRSLAAVVVDEQHRFGVIQRDELARRAASQGHAPHVLYMTATPIPRTLALTLYGDLDLTVMAAAPAGRRKIVTRIVQEDKRGVAYQFMREQLDAGRQAYVVCPTIEESESLSAAAAVDEAKRLSDGELRGYRVAVLHGQMKPAAREAGMRAFKSGETQVLVATSVIEVGIDVPNATVMVVEGAERFGLAQLHQLRGRVGRGTARSYCLLFARPETDQARARLEALRRTTDGFDLADRDLEIRGEGQVLGARQAGANDLRLARLVRDRRTVERARAAARRTLVGDAFLENAGNAALADAVAVAFGSRLDWLLRV
jgi:ATP-dependent DNA helicase RecG